MLAAHAQHVAEVIDQALAHGDNVVSDRYSGSTLAYQGYGRGLPLAALREMNSWATGQRAPDIVVLLDLPVTVTRQRLGSSSPDRIEAEGDAFLERVRDGFCQLAASDPLHWRVVDAAGTIDEVAERVWKAVR